MGYKFLGDIAKLRNENIKDNSDDSLLYVTTAHLLPEKRGLDSNLESSLNKSGKHFYKGDILVSNIRPYFKKIWFATSDGITSNDVLIFTPKEGVDLSYLYYLLMQDTFFDYATKTSKGTKMPRGDKSALKQFEVYIPKLEMQVGTSKKLKSFDKKIETNNKIIENLETQAQAIFKSWFFDFEPFQEGEFVESEFGMIPEGWEVVPVKEMSQSVITGKTPSTKNKEYFGNFMPFIKIPDMHNKVYTITTEVYLSEKGVQSQKNKTLPKNSICVSCIATVGLVNLVLEESQTNQQINSIIPAEGISPYYLYFAMKNLYDYLNSIASGSTQKNINKNDFERIKIINPNHKIMDRYHYFSKPLFELIKNLQLQNQNLAQLRDTLLPKLMSGEIRVGQDEVEEIENPL